MTLSLKKIALFSLAFITSALSIAQVKFQKNYEHTFKEAETQQRPVFVSVDFSTVPNAPALINIYVPNQKVAQYYNSNFINYRVEHRSGDGMKLRKNHDLTIFPSFLFLKPDGSLILKSSGVPRNSDFFMKLATEAEQRYKNSTGLADYDLRYKNNENIDRQFLKDYIALRERSGIFSNAKLIERYVDFLSISELNSYDEILFIHKAGPIAFGRAYNLAGTNRKIVDSIFTYAPLQDRIDINNRIITNTQTEAIFAKDKNMAYALSNFVRNTWMTNYKEGDKSATQNLLAFYKATTDTSAYYSQAGYYYDQYYMSISVDSIKRARELNRRKLDSLNATVEKLKRDGKANQMFSVTSIGTSSEGNILNAAHMLNNAAWDFYALGTRNPLLLNKALLWSRRSIEIDPNATYFDTLAHIFYRLGWYDEALLNQSKAISMAEKEKKLNKDQINGFRKEAAKMKAKTL